MIRRPDFFIISGNGRNSGKTTLACSIIKQASRDFAVAAIKVSPHFHPPSDPSGTPANHEHYIIRKETDPKGRKDSSRMLAAGASQVFYLEVKDDHLEEAMQALFASVSFKGPVVCESGRMRDVIEPSLFILVDRDDGREDKPGFIRYAAVADRVILFDESSSGIDPLNIRFNGKRWLAEE